MKLSPILTFGAFAACTVLATVAVAAESVSVLLQKAIYAEETEGNLESAIRLYEQIATDAASNRPMVAQAQYRLAVCYQKQGKKDDAVRLLNDLLKQPPLESGLGVKVRDTLGQLGASPAEAVTLRKVPLQDGYIYGISRDGRHAVTCPDENGWDTAVCDLATGKTSVVLKGSKDAVRWGDAPFSPDGTHIAFDIKMGAIQVAKIDGSNARTLYKDDGNGGVWTIDWSADGQQLIVGTWDKTTDAICSIEVATGQKKVLKVLPWAEKIEHERDGWHLSRDGRYLAYHNGVAHRKISVVDLVTGVDTTIVDREVLHILGWAPSDAKLLFTSSRSGVIGLWSVAVRDGKAAGVPQLLRASVGEAEKGWVTHDGRIFYTEGQSSSADVYIANADFETGDISDLRRATERFPGTQIWPTWSKSGDAMMVAIWNGQQKRFIAIGMTSDEQRDFPAAKAFSGRLQQYTWSEEGNFMLVLSRNVAGERGIHRFEMESGKSELVLGSPKGTWNVMPRLTADGSSFYYIRREFKTPDEHNSDWTDSIRRRNLRTGHEEVTFEPGEKLSIWCPLALSADGQSLAFVTSNQNAVEEFNVAIKVVHLADNTSRELHRFAPRENVTSLAWTPDGQRLIYAKQPPGKNEYDIGATEVSALAVDSLRTTRLHFSQQGIRDVTVNADGRRIAFRAGAFASGTDLWAIEGLLANATSKAANE